MLIDTLLLIALPASGKSEVRTFLSTLTPEQCASDFSLGETAQLDDYPYVHMMRRIDEELDAIGAPRLFFAAADRPFKDPIEWGTLIELLNEDYADLRAARRPEPQSPAETLLARIDAARAACGGAKLIALLADDVRAKLVEGIANDARDLYAELRAAIPDSLDGRTVVIEFARGGAEGASMPLEAPRGYAYSLSRLSDEILSRASVLYIWVTPEESRRKNVERADPNDPGSILHHGVPEAVMRQEYGCDDIGYLVERAKTAGTVEVEAHGKTYVLPLARLDNRQDLTSFVRGDRDVWPEQNVAALYGGLSEALTSLAKPR
ncbi:MAG: hypothetical protein KC503_37515 [Myxococcales bacterium]|nr:hypothetical protein [Myxococcales bacterium]